MAQTVDKDKQEIENEASPPVPTMSVSSSPLYGNLRFLLLSTFAQPAISSATGPLLESAVRIAAIWRSSMMPSVKSSMNISAVSRLKSLPSVSVFKIR